MLKLRLMKSVQMLAVIFALLLTSCGGGDVEPTPTLGLDEIQTLAIETFSAALTQTARAAPSETPVATLTPPATFPPFSTSTGGIPFGPTSAATSAATSCYRLTWVSDVSIPDNTAMKPGEAFTKTWKVKNSGTCAWEAGFKFAFITGEAMNGTTYTLPSAVPAEALWDISVPMVAPANKTGTLRGDWRMSTASGQFFGEVIYVVIVVGGTTGTVTPGATSTTGAGGSATATSTPTATATPTATPTQ